MKHLFNNISEEEKNRIREQHTGGMKIAIDNFKKLVETKLGDAKPFINEANMETCEQCGNELTEGGECMECGTMYEEEMMEQDNDYYINKELVIKGLSPQEGEQRTIYVKTKPGIYTKDNETKPGIYAEFSYSENDKRGYYQRLGQEVKFSCDQNYVNIPPIQDVQFSGFDAGIKFAGKLSNEDNNWVQGFCKSEKYTGPTENEISPKIEVFTTLNNAGSNNPSYIVDGMDIIKDGAVKDSSIPNLKTVEVNAESKKTGNNVKITLMLYCDGTQKKFYIGNRSKDMFNLFLKDEDKRGIDNLMKKYFCKKK